jgi:hypothetical protein
MAHSSNDWYALGCAIKSAFKKSCIGWIAVIWQAGWAHAADPNLFPPWRMLMKLLSRPDDLLNITKPGEQP